MAADVEIKEKITADKRNIFSIDIKEKAALYKVYMPFINSGAFFINTETEYTLGDEVYLLIKILDDPEKYTITGKVIWITPRCAQGGRSAGVGVQFTGPEANNVRNKVEGYLAGALKSEQHTDTM